MKRYDFVIFLRGGGAIVVLLSHLLMMFWSGGVGGIWPFLTTTNSPFGLRAINPADFIARLHLNAGNIGVAFFFLITGFLLSGSIRKIKTPGKFLLLKCLHIYPVYIVEFTVTFIFIWLYTNHVGIDFPYSFGDWLSQVTLIRAFLWQPSIDGLSWTLVADVELYLLFTAMIAVKRISAKDCTFVGGMLTLVTVVCGINMSRLLGNGMYTLFYLCSYITTAVFCLTYMLIGFIISEYENENIDLWQLIGSEIILYICFIFSCYANNSFDDSVAYQTVCGYSFSLLIFVICYMLYKTGHCKRLFANALIGKVAKISYSLYILHGLNGYIIETFLFSKGINNYLNFFLTVTAVTVLSVFMYYCCEKPFGKLYREVYKKIII